VFYFANVSGKPVETTVMLRGAMQLELWDPHTGSESAVAAFSDKSMNPYTRTKISLKPFRSCFLVETEQK
jgi:hypothetical protein